MEDCYPHCYLMARSSFTLEILTVILPAAAFGRIILKTSFTRWGLHLINAKVQLECLLFEVFSLVFLVLNVSCLYQKLDILVGVFICSCACLQIDIFFGTFPHRLKIFVAGNHDSCLEGIPLDQIQSRLTKCTYLCDSSTFYAGIKFYGCPHTAYRYNNIRPGYGSL